MKPIKDSWKAIIGGILAAIVLILLFVDTIFHIKQEGFSFWNVLKIIPLSLILFFALLITGQIIFRLFKNRLPKFSQKRREKIERN
jgi:uncharacterized integral membrane protein